MENFKFNLIYVFFIVVILLLGFLGYTSLQTGGENVALQRARKAERDLAAKEQELADLRSRVTLLEDDVAKATEPEPEAPSAVTPSTPATAPSTPSTSTATPTSKTQQALLDALVKMKSRGVILEPGDKGTDVGTVQKFLNVYNKTSDRIDNDFGPGMRQKVEAFQKKEGLTPDGGIGPTTLQKMISWLEKNT